MCFYTTLVGLVVNGNLQMGQRNHTPVPSETQHSMTQGVVKSKTIAWMVDTAVIGFFYKAWRTVIEQLVNQNLNIGCWCPIVSNMGQLKHL